MKQPHKRRTQKSPLKLSLKRAFNIVAANQQQTLDTLLEDLDAISNKLDNILSKK